MKTRVLILEQQSYWGGAQRVLQTVLDSLRDQIDPLVALPEPGAFGLDLRKQQIETLVYPLGSYQSGRKSITDMLAFGPRSLCCALLLAREIVKRAIQLVYINGPRCLPAGAIAARLTGRPSLFSLHNTLSRRADVMLASWGAACTSRIVACSQAAAAPLLKANPGLASRLQILYPPVQDHINHRSRPRSQQESAPFVIGMVSRITPAKGHHVLLEALERLKPCDERKIVFLGAPAPGNVRDAEYLSSLRRWAAERGFERSIHWAGYQADPHPYYEAMDVLAVPSVGDASSPGGRAITCFSSEGMPIVILEAFQRGVPVVASRTAGTPELVKDGVNGLLVPPGNSEELAKALERLQFEPGLHARLAAQACASIDQRFSRELYCSALSGLISELCASSAPASAVLTGPRPEVEVPRTSGP
jgi:glycosyltransferase involved in cell wall biosynthesis